MCCFHRSKLGVFMAEEVDKCQILSVHQIIFLFFGKSPTFAARLISVGASRGPIAQLVRAPDS